MKPSRVPTIRSTLALLVIACMIPASLVAAVLITYNYQRERSTLVRDSILTARALTSALDRELAGIESALFALATSPFLSSNDLVAFEEQAKEVLPILIADNIVLIDANGQQVANTLRSSGEPLPYGTSLELRRIFDTGRPVITNLFAAPVAGRLLVAIGVPVRRGNEIIYSLNAGIFPDRLSGILIEQHLPPEWIAGIVDSTGTAVTRTRDAARFVGRKGDPAFIKQLTAVTEGALETTTPEGIPVITVFNRSVFSNWTVVIGIPTRGLTSERWHLLWWFVLGLLLVLLTSLAVAWSVAGRISRSIHALCGPALALGSGEAVTVPPLRLKEADDVGHALVRASQKLHEAHHRAYHDALTGLANRLLFNEIVDHELAVCHRTGAALAVLYVDLDGFKPVNDIHGHAIGDDLLRAVAARLKRGVRSSDLVARLGGDEFAIVLVNTGMVAAATTAETLAAGVAMPYSLGGLTIQISASIGVAAYPESGISSEALLHSADKAMYKAKSSRRR
jgi:diguanylate cyclase (GGDEF)-like protein